MDFLLTPGVIAKPCLNDFSARKDDSLDYIIDPAGAILLPERKIHSDGSIIRKPGRKFGRLGFCIAALDQDDGFMAKPFGNTPF